MRNLLFASAIVSLALPVSAGEAIIQQVPPTSTTTSCALCYNATEEEIEAIEGAGVAYGVTAGPPNVNHAVQVGDDNTAIGVSIGENNYIGQFQFGFGNHSAVGVIADDTSVAVVQQGNGLESNLLVWGNPGAPIGVYQPPGSAPVNAAILTDPQSGVQVILPGNATTVIVQ